MSMSMVHLQPRPYLIAQEFMGVVLLADLCHRTQLLESLLYLTINADWEREHQEDWAYRAFRQFRRGYVSYTDARYEF